MNTAISVSGLVKTFGSTVALDGLDLEVATGEVHGFLGPNGSGKTTTIRILLGLLRADRGEVSLLGGDPWREAAELHKRLAYVPGEVALWPNLTGGEVIDLMARLRGGIDKQRRAQLLDRFDLDPTKKTRSYSKGNRQKVALVAALASDVELYLLDEPTSGLDPIMEAAFKESIGELRTRGRTVLLSSHILAEAEALSDRVSIIRAGRIVQSGTLKELRHLTRTTVIVRTERPADLIHEVPGVAHIAHEDGQLVFDVDTDHIDEAMDYLAPLKITSLISHPPTLEELFLREFGDRVEAESEEVHG
ncbi:MAG TPA: ABC transporter ATP-binding protein [Nocardioidaceae bacterium]|nr:ABC transporter ATP-binding protein [Nocardioidaceae bacterium]